jgi:alkylation response protein AidB-like acyl-CoA dehydrogenase
VTDEWFTMAFCETNTSTVIFRNFPVEASDIFGAENWYVNRRGFWIGAVGPAACWGGGAAGLLDYAMTRKRHDPHTLAHLAAISANVFAIESLLASCGNAFDNHQPSIANLQIIALKARHLVEMHCTDIIRRFARAYGPFPMACDKNVSRRYQELDLYLRQNHAERDLESLGRTMLNL